MQWAHMDIHDLSEADYASVYRGLSPARRQRVDRLRQPQDKQRSLAGEYLAKRLLAEVGGMSPSDVVIDIDDRGKPFAQGMTLHVSIAHCEEMVVCAVDDTPIGIDIERISPRRLALTKRVCVEEELLYIFGHRPGFDDFTYTTDRELLTRFYEVWTAKEAYFKRIGTGITDMKAVNILSLNRQVFSVDDYLVQVVCE